MVLTKQCIGEQLQPDWELTKQQAPETVESLLELIKSSLKYGQDAWVSGFSRLCVKAKRDRKDRNQSAGRNMMSRSRRVASFKYSGRLQLEINTH